MRIVSTLIRRYFLKEYELLLKTRYGCVNGTEFKKYIGENIAKIRKFRGYSQEYISEIIDISPNSYSRIERGLNFPSAESFAKIIDALDISPCELFNFPNEESEEKIRKEVRRKLKIIEKDREKMINIWLYINSIV